ncbi:hypothetical protein EPA93_37955 [Ktedonosporobacter rubrisoli]|uniref:Uncharacterized protein n=1 Tax=Ktedonosporobacter rubrisoli TaxID=2509675 RepID=A0A4P6JZV6_KTERU|nr:hypothetical protein [Ktedonosporobacter rubrisoli]QBD81448.1 hypothetical protein EPA93_37955 [Ktedonosporobacter rubrisoli]
MKNFQHSSMGGFSEFDEGVGQFAATELPITETEKGQAQLDFLLEQGFDWDEALKLLHLHEHIYENAEVRQRMAEDCRMLFVKWLYEQGELHED